MKRILLIVTMVFLLKHSSFSQTAFAMATGNYAGSLTASFPVHYSISNNYGSPPIGKFKNLEFDIKENPEKGMLTFTINSDKSFSFLLTIENGAGDILIFEEIELHKGLNIIPFATNGASINAFDVKLSELKSAYNTMFTLVKH